MARPKSSKPSYCLHRSSGRAHVTIAGQTTYLGPFGSPESRDKYDRIIAEWIASGRAPDIQAPSARGALTVSDICLAFWEHATQTYPAAPFAAGKRPEG